MTNEEEFEVAKTYRAELGGYLLGQETGGRLFTPNIIYCGMVNLGVFSLAMEKPILGAGNYDTVARVMINVYFPAKQGRKVMVGRLEFEVKEIDTDSILLELITELNPKGKNPDDVIQTKQDFIHNRNSAPN